MEQVNQVDAAAYLHNKKSHAHSRTKAVKALVKLLKELYDPETRYTRLDERATWIATHLEECYFKVAGSSAAEKYRHAQLRVTRYQTRCREQPDQAYLLAEGLARAAERLEELYHQRAVLIQEVRKTIAFAFQRMEVCFHEGSKDCRYIAMQSRLSATYLIIQN